MELQSVRNSKQALEAIFASQVRDGEPRRRRFALGVAPVDSAEDYKLAVRAPSPEVLTDEDLAVIYTHANDVDLRYTGGIGALSAAAPSTASGSLRIGSSVAHCATTAGTLGFFARRIVDGAIGFVSNNHILACEDRGKEGDEILHPSPSDGGVRPRDVVAYLAGGYPKLKRAKARVDCAFATLAPGISFDVDALGSAGVLAALHRDAAPQPEVAKIGRTTHFTQGRISAFELDELEVGYSFGSIKFYDQIEVESADGEPFSKNGDSGALVFTHPGNVPLGLLFAGSTLGGNGNAGLTYVHPIDAVLSALGVTFLQ